MDSAEPPRRVICANCGARSWLRPGEERPCSACGGAYRAMAPLESLVDRWFAPADSGVSELYPRHLKLIELMWTREGRGRATYEALGLDRVSYSRFVPRATAVVVRGLREGWIAAEVPAAPTEDDSAYRIRFLDPERWADELAAAFEGSATSGDANGAGVDVEGDPDAA